MMLQVVATLGSLLLAMLALGVIAASLRDEWPQVIGALGYRPAPPARAVAIRPRAGRRATMLRVPPPAPRRAAA